MKQFLTLLFILCYSAAFSQSPKSNVLFKLMGHSDDLECLAISGNGKLIASGSWDGMVNLFYTDSNYTPIGTFIDHFSTVNCISFTNSGKMMVTGGSDGKIFTYKIDSFGYVEKDKTASLHRMSINAVYIDPGGKFVFTGSNDGTIIQYELAKNKERKVTNTNPVSSIAVGMDRKTIYCSDNTSIIKRYDMLNPNVPVVNYEGHTDQVNCVVLSKDGKFLISASSDKTIKIWNTLTGKIEKTLTGHDWKVLSVAISANGKYIVSGSNDGSTKLWDVETGKELRSFDDLGTNVRGVGFSNDNTKIYTALSYSVDSFETKGILALASGIEKLKKEPPKATAKAPLPKGTTPTKGSTPSKPADNGTTKKVIKKTEELEISEEKKVPEPKKDDNRQD
ncbi:MAG: WD40 repeat domain-containing protein [Bacteroidia bacterium]